MYAEKYPEEGENTRASWASQMLRFVTKLKIGDDVVTWDRERRLYVVGKITSDYEWAPNVLADAPHVRRVKWTGAAPRDRLAAPTRNSLGSVLTLFEIPPDAAKDILRNTVPLDGSPETVAAPAPKTATDEVRDLSVISEETFEKADEFIEDAINALDWMDMQSLVAGVLRAMGYRTRVSEVGPDRGVDILASPDGLGLQEPRIFVEVKHRESTIGAEKIRAFLGGRKHGDRCLYVSTGGFTKDAHYEADRASVPVTLITLPRLRQLVVEHYDQLDAETRALVPLRRLYWPVAKV
jgi:restriction system protein